jgi:hypothetical protein
VHEQRAMSCPTTVITDPEGSDTAVPLGDNHLDIYSVLLLNVGTAHVMC